jgi:hypothetical protein
MSGEMDRSSFATVANVAEFQRDDLNLEILGY